MILNGEGYALTISPEAQLQKAKILDEALAIVGVTTNEESAVASYEMRKLAQMRINVDKNRKEIKEPVIRIGKEIDRIAAEFMLEIDAEENRIKGLIGNHAAEMLKLKRQAEEKELLAFEAEKAARELAESGGIAAVLDAKQALQDKLKASDEVVATKVAQGVRFVWDFKIVSIDDVMKYAPDLVEVTPRRREILAWLKGLEENEDRDAAAIASQVGIIAYKIPSVLTR